MQPGEYYTRGKKSYDIIREHFFTSEWNEVFDLIEFIIEFWPHNAEDLCTHLNSVLTEENSAYRLAIGGQFVEIANDSEIAEVDAAAQTGLDGVSTHIAAAVKFMSDRKNPNYRNSVKESISAVESLFKVLTNSKAATLSDGLAKGD